MLLSRLINAFLPFQAALVKRLGRDIPNINDLSIVGASRMAKSTTGQESIIKSTPLPRRSLKKLPEIVETACLKNQNRMPVRLMFQDEARFGRMSDLRSCWAPAPHRPTVGLALIREFRYEYAAVSPWDSTLDYMTAEKMNTESMSCFPKQVSQAYPEEFIFMILDGASSHRSKELKVPENVSLVPLPFYSPKLNPVELIWNMLRLNYFTNRAFDSFDAATLQADTGLRNVAANKNAMKSLTHWPWINAIWNAI